MKNKTVFVEVFGNNPIKKIFQISLADFLDDPKSKTPKTQTHSLKCCF